MATESPLVHDGAQCILGFNANNNSTTVGSTALLGPSGSGQFLAVRLSTTADRTVLLASTATSGVRIYGVLQNKGSTGQVADVGLYGVSKVICGATANITGGVQLSVTSTAPGSMIAYSSAAQTMPVAIALETPSAVGAVFSALIYGAGAGQNI
jgi:hypothetical protein